MHSIFITRPIPQSAIDLLKSKGYIVDVRTDIDGTVPPRILRPRYAPCAT